FCREPAAPETYPLSLHDALPIYEHQRHVAVVYGHAVLDTGTRAVDLQAGESIDAPLPDASEPTPSLSLRPLEETAWARTFDRAADRKSTRLNSSHVKISYAVFCL